MLVPDCWHMANDTGTNVQYYIFGLFLYTKIKPWKCYTEACAHEYLLNSAKLIQWNHGDNTSSSQGCTYVDLFDTKDKWVHWAIHCDDIFNVVLRFQTTNFLHNMFCNSGGPQIIFECLDITYMLFGKNKINEKFDLVWCSENAKIWSIWTKCLMILQLWS